MVNENIQGVIPLSGRGFQFKRGGNYQSGEYPELTNAEIATDGSLVPRRNIQNPSDSPLIPYGYKILGNAKDVVLIKSLDRVQVLQAFGDTFVAPNWTQAKLLNTAVYPNVLSHEVVGVLWYNNRVVWVSAAVTDQGGGNRREQLWIHQNALYDPLGLPVAANFDHDLATHTKVYEGLTSLPVEVVYPINVKAFFIHKNRLWIQTAKTLFFSEVGVVNNFSVVGGKAGFINMNDYLATDAVSNGNDIYISGSSVIERLSYSTDPNNVADLSLVRVTNNLGAIKLAVYESQIYFVANDSLYSVNGTTVSRVVELNINRVNGDIATPYVAIYAWNSYLIFRSYNSGVADTRVHYQTWREIKYPSTYYSPHITFLNMDNGAMHQIHYLDQFPTGSDAPEASDNVFAEDDQLTALYARGVVVDMLPVGTTDRNNSSWLWFLTVKLGYTPELPGGFGITSSSRVSIMKNDEREAGTGTSGATLTAPTYFDTLYSAAGAKQLVCPYTCIEFPSYSPDGSEYFVKKFRNLAIEADWPTRFYNLYVAYGNNPFPTTPWSFTAPEGEDSKDRNPEAQRYGLNQRARSIAFKIFTRRMYISFANDFVDPKFKASYFNITDMRVLWSYTARAPLGRTKDKS